MFCSNRAIFEEQYLVVLKGINTFNTKNQIKLLRYMFYDIDNNPNIRGNIFEEKRRQLRKNIAIMMASNPDATLEDMTNAAQTTGDINIVRDTIEMAKRELEKEMKKEYMDVNAISQICNCAHRTVDGISDQKYANAIKKTFSSNTILAADAKYVQKTQKSLEERVNELDYDNFKLKAELDKKNKEIETKDRDSNLTIQDLQTKLANEQQKNAKLVQQLNELESILREMQAMMKTIKMKAAAITAEGMFGRGKKAEELNDYVQEALKSKIKVMIKD